MMFDDIGGFMTIITLLGLLYVALIAAAPYVAAGLGILAIPPLLALLQDGNK